MTLNHLKDSVGHDAGKDHLCRHQDQYDNLFYLCKVVSLTCISNEKSYTTNVMLNVASLFLIIFCCRAGFWHHSTDLRD